MLRNVQTGDPQGGPLPREMVVDCKRGFSPRISRHLMAPASCMGGVVGRGPLLLPQRGKRSATSTVVNLHWLG
jgi:hypothetical protein